MTNLENLARTLEPLPQEVRALRHEMGDVKARLIIVESQIVHLRGEMRDGFSAIRGEMAVQKTELGAELRERIETRTSELRSEIALQGRELRAEMAAQKVELRQDISALSVEMVAHFLAAEQKTRVLFEEFLGKRKAIDEGHPDT